MRWDRDGAVADGCMAFYKVGEAWGGLSNMSNEFPLAVGRVRVGSSEALYQAMRFPHRPDRQREILDAPHAMRAKMNSTKGGGGRTGRGRTGTRSRKR